VKQGLTKANYVLNILGSTKAAPPQKTPFFMKYPYRTIAALVLIFAAVLPMRATVILDDTFADGTRNNQNLPTDSAWFASSGALVTATPGAMTMAMSASAILAVTYFAPTNNPISLSVGDTLLATFSFLFSGVDTTNSSTGFRVALCDFSTTRSTADLGSNSGQGTNVPAYAVFQNMSATFSSFSPISIVVRTNLGGPSLLGASSNWIALVAGPGTISSFTGFTNGTPYTLQFSLQRVGVSSMQITATWMNASNGATISTSYTDTAASNFNFDGIGIRPQNAANAATNIIFNEVRVDYLPAGTPASISGQPQDQSVFVGQNATFTVNASGSAPLNFQWFYNNDTLLPNATNASLTISNAQVSDTGGYSVTVSNVYGSPVTSASANLTVTTPTAPSIVTQPQSLTVLPGQSAVFSVSAGGSAPLSYQWYFNTNTLLSNATGNTLTVTNAQLADQGTYSVVVSNFVSTATSSNAVLTVNTNPVAPSFTSQPASQLVLAGGTAVFNAVAAGTSPITYQWNRNGTPIAGATSSTLTLTNVQSTNAGSYTLTASNSVGGATSSAATLTVTPAIPVPNSDYNLVGFGGSTTGGGLIPETDAAYRKVTNALDLANALVSAYKTAGSVKVIEIMTNLDLGWNEIGTAAQTLVSTPFRSGTAPKLHPVLLVTGESLCDIKPRTGLTIFSANGATIRHCNFNIKSTGNIIVRNLKFDQNWEWDESSKGGYDQNDWDFITLGNGGAVSNIWIDHCTFTKSYDGVVDTKAGSSAITISWCNYIGDDGATNTNSWVWQQINYLEQSPASYPMYNFLRTHGFTTTNIVDIIQAHDKTHLAGANSLDSNNATISMTFHHLNLEVWDRCVPRLRAGNVHDFNIYVDDTRVLAARRLRDAIAAGLSTADKNTLNNTYSIQPPINGAISTESGALLVEKSVYINCLWPLRNNQTDPSNPAYTGKIQALDSIYQFDNTTVRGNSTDPGNPMGPFQAPVIPFSWNLPGNQLPYPYSPDDPAQLQAIVTNPTAGAGAGVLTWAKTNWLMTTYAPTAPFIVAQPQDVAATPGDTATFSVFAGGSATLTYHWYFNTNTFVPNATNSTLTLTNVQADNAGTYSVIVSNAAGFVTSTNASLAVSTTTPATPHLSTPGYTNGTFSLTVDGPAGHDYVVQTSSNLADWTSIYTNPMPTLPFIWNDSGASDFSRRFYRIQVGL
jgi:pectate lyase